MKIMIEIGVPLFTRYFELIQEIFFQAFFLTGVLFLYIWFTNFQPITLIESTQYFLLLFLYHIPNFLMIGMKGQGIEARVIQKFPQLYANGSYLKNNYLGKFFVTFLNVNFPF
jgi:hypothetical protein